MAAPHWNSKPEEYCMRAKARAIASLHAKHPKGLTKLEQAYLQAVKDGRIPATDPSKIYPFYETF